MNNTPRYIALAVVVIAIVSAILYLESLKPETIDPGQAEIAATDTSEESTEVQKIIAEKEENYERAKEIVNPSGFINTEEITIEELIGKQVILVDFWTYSCINCQRTLPYLTGWHEKYSDKGLTIIGMHTPEFEFEKDFDNVVRATEKFGVEYPVVQDNDRSTWRAYKNRYWPRKYIIDIDGFIVYDHIGEGAYEETEQIIQELLEERMERLNIQEEIDKTFVESQEVIKNVGTPEVYFGSDRNDLLANGEAETPGLQSFELPSSLENNKLYLGGDWLIEPEFITNPEGNTVIAIKYRAKDVYMVASAEQPTTISITLDGQPVGENAGENIDPSTGKGTIKEDQLYKIIEADESAIHTLEITVEDPSIKVFTFTFG